MPEVTEPLLSDWIQVKERRPEIGQLVAVFDCKGFGYVVNYDPGACWADGSYRAWYPLPAIRRAILREEE